MREQLEKRLLELKNEYESGQKMITELELKLGNIRQTMLRISGAIQVLEETLSAAEAENRQPEQAVKTG